MIYIVIPVHNRKHFTRECLQALSRQTYKDHRVVVVDDGSADGTMEMLRSEFPSAAVLEGTGELYWTASVNMGIAYALERDADYVMTLNNDGFPEETFLENMMRWAARLPDAIFCAYEVDALTKEPYYGGEVINWTWGSSTFLLDKLPVTLRRGVHPVSVAPGRGMFIPAKVFRAIGMFNASGLPHYMADYDFACLARRKGFGLYCNYDAVLFSYSSESGDKEIIRNKSLKNYFNHLFSIKGGGNLKNYTIYTVRNAPPALVPLHLMKGYAQRILGYFLK